MISSLQIILVNLHRELINARTVMVILTHFIFALETRLLKPAKSKKKFSTKTSNEIRKRKNPTLLMGDVDFIFANTTVHFTL